MVYTERAIATYLRSTSFLSRESVLTYHPLSCLLSFSPMNFKILCLEPLKHYGSPK